MKGIKMGCVQGVGQNLLANDEWSCDGHGTDKWIMLRERKAYTLFASIPCKITASSIRGQTN